jgi:hypothetical protein
MPELPEFFNFSFQRSRLCQKHKHLSPFGKGLVVIAVTSLKVLCGGNEHHVKRGTLVISNMLEKSQYTKFDDS